MVQTNELRLGNFVLINSKIIKMDMKIFHAVLHYFDGYTPEGIPLSEEWLLKFGFARHGEYRSWQIFYPYLRDVRTLTIEGKIGFSAYVTSLDKTISISTLKYVHQLQNLHFALTGTELEVKNEIHI